MHKKASNAKTEAHSEIAHCLKTATNNKYLYTHTVYSVHCPRAGMELKRTIPPLNISLSSVAHVQAGQACKKMQSEHKRHFRSHPYCAHGNCPNNLCIPVLARWWRVSCKKRVTVAALPPPLLPDLKSPPSPLSSRVKSAGEEGGKEGNLICEPTSSSPKPFLGGEGRVGGGMHSRSRRRSQKPLFAHLRRRRRRRRRRHRRQGRVILYRDIFALVQQSNMSKDVQRN